MNEKYVLSIKRLVSHNYYTEKMFRILLGKYLKIKYIVKHSNNKIEGKYILFESFQGRAYSCNPKRIYEVISNDNRFNGFTIVWAFKDIESKKCLFDDNADIKFVKYNTSEYYSYLSKSKYIITNSRVPARVKFKAEQIYVQTWHGTPLKRIGFDIISDGRNGKDKAKHVYKSYDNEAKRIDYMISPSEYTTDKLISAFNLKKYNKEDKVLEVGYPRNDSLSDVTTEHILSLKQKYNIPKDKKVILYAPTWRDDQYNVDIGYTYDLGLDFRRLREDIGDEYIVLFRTHYFISNSFDFTSFEDFIYNLSDVDDINELYSISDLLITDYSSVLFDYAILEKPMIFYMYDKDKYGNSIRGFYIDIEELPGEIVLDQETLCDSIKNPVIENEKYTRFRDKYCYLDDGKAGARAVDLIFGDE